MDRNERDVSPAPAMGSRPRSSVIALQKAIGNRALSRLLAGDRRPLRTARAPRRVLQRNRYQMDVSGNQFGETYHIALAMIFAKFRGDRVILPKWLTSTTLKEGQTPAKQDQKAFLTKVYRYLNQHDLSDIESIGRPDDRSQSLSHNVASTMVGQMIEDTAKWQNTDLLSPFGAQPSLEARALAFLRMIFLSAPDIGQLVGEQLRRGGHVATQKGIIDAQIRTALDQLFNIQPTDPNIGQTRQGRPRYVIFNRQQKGSEERNLTEDLVDCVVEDAATIGVTQFLINTSAADPFPKPYDGDRFVNIGPLVQGTPPPQGVDPRTYQLNVMNMLHREYGVVRIVGMKSGAMDGPAMIGIPTVYFDTYSTGRLSFITPYLPLKRVDVSHLGNRAPANAPAKREWKDSVKAQLAQART